MYIPYYELTQSISKILPKAWQKKFVDYGYNLKIEQNLAFINKNIVNVKKRLSKKIKTQKLNVIFYVYDDTKWKCQSVYDLMEKSENFIPYIYVTKNAAPQNNCNYQTDDDLKKVYDFFVKKSMRVKYAYNIEKQKYIPFEKMNPKPDIIIYQHPWYVERTQGPVVCSKFAITCYVPYFLPTSEAEFEYYLRFHQYVEHFYVLNDSIKQTYSTKMNNSGSNLVVVGHPQLDSIYSLESIKEDLSYIIYAPHWTVDNNNNLYWGTFLNNYKFILEYAKKHSEFKWIFKPHPCLKSYLINKNYMSEEDVSNYWNEWSKIGFVCESGNYLNLLKKSKLLITDCGSFLTEYFILNKPCIYLNSDKQLVSYNNNVKNIIKTYYNVFNTKQLQEYLEQIIYKNNDSKKNERAILLSELKFNQIKSAEKIINHLKNLLLMN